MCASPACSGSTGSYSCDGPVAIACASETSFAVFQGGTIRAWGDDFGDTIDSPGLLGIAGTATASSTAPVQVMEITTATKIAAGDAHACALLADGSVECWGDNYYGQIGPDPSVSPSVTTPAVGTPVAVTGLSGVTAIAAGIVHTCALASDGTVQCWGSNDYGELGNATSTTSNGSDKCSTTPAVWPG